MKYAKHILTLALLAACTACTGDFEEYNRNPNKLTDGSIAPSSMMEPLVYDAAKSMASYMLSIANEISQVTVAKSTPRREHCYNLADGNFANIWNLCYKWAANADHMRGLAIDQKQPNYEAIALTMKVYYLSICCDMFGSIAYTEALKGSEGIRQPHIDTQKEAYEAMIADLEQANSLYQPSVVLANATKDGIYGGDIAKWKKFTNTLRLRLLMRVSGRNNAFTPSVGDQIKQLLADPATYPVFESNDDEATVKFTAAAEYYLSYFNTSSFTSETDLSGDHHVSERFLSLIYNQADGTTDPRLRIWIKPRYNASQIQPMVGAISGCTNSYNSRPIADQEPFLHYETLVSDTNPIYLMGYDELLFIKAEAALKGWIAGSAQEYYVREMGPVRTTCGLPRIVGQLGIDDTRLDRPERHHDPPGERPGKMGRYGTAAGRTEMALAFLGRRIPDVPRNAPHGLSRVQDRTGHHRAGPHRRQVHRPLPLSADRRGQQPRQLRGGLRRTGRLGQRQHDDLPRVVERPGRGQGRRLAVAALLPAQRNRRGKLITLKRPKS